MLSSVILAATCPFIKGRHNKNDNVLVVLFQVMEIGRNAGQICMKCHELLGCVGEHAVFHIVGLLT